MPYACCVPGCRGNYKNGPKLSTFRFPKDELLRQKWIVGIRRKDYVVSKSSSVCELHFKETDFETETSAYDSKTGKTITIPLLVKRLKKDVVPSILPATSSSASNRETPSEKRTRLETEQLELALHKSLKKVPDENSQQASIVESSSSSPALRPLEKKEKESKKRTLKRKGKSVASSSKKRNDTSSPKSMQSNGVPEVTQSVSSHNRNHVSNSSTHLLEVQIKEEPTWEDGIGLSGDTSKNNPDNSIAENVQITCVRSISSDSNAEVPSSEEENAASKPEENFDHTFYTKPLSIDQRDKAFGNFISCELSDLRENPELYMKTKQGILKLLTEAHFEQMSSGNKLASKVTTILKSSAVL